MTAQQGDGRWPVWLIAVVLYPLAAGAMAVNLFFAVLLARVFAEVEMTPVAAVWGGLVLGIPAALWFARWTRRLMDEADAAS